MLWGIFFLGAFVVFPIFLIVLLLRGRLSSFTKRHRAVLWLLVGAAGVALGVSRVVDGVTGVGEWAQLAWHFVTSLGFIGLAYKARREDQALAIEPNPQGSVPGSGPLSG